MSFMDSSGALGFTESAMASPGVAPSPWRIVSDPPMVVMHS
jgi:hypothetical protein